MKIINYTSLPISECLAIINIDSQIAREAKLSVDAHYIRCTKGNKNGLSILKDIIDIIRPYGEKVTIENNNEYNCSNITLSDTIKLIGEESKEEGDYSVSINVYIIKNKVTRSCTESCII